MYHFGYAEATQTKLFILLAEYFFSQPIYFYFFAGEREREETEPIIKKDVSS